MNRMSTCNHRACLLSKCLVGLLLFLAAFCTTNAFAQPDSSATAPPDTLRHTFSGTVYASETAEPQAFINLVFDSLQTGTRTNLDGEFSIQLPPGTHVFRIEALGFEPLRDSVTLTDEPVLGRQVIIQNKQYELEEEIVIEYYNPAIYIMEQAIERKPQNRNAGREAYSYEAYNKLTLSVNNVTDEKMDNLLLRPASEFVEEHRGDTALLDSNQKLRLTVFISESLTEVHYRAPDDRREIIKAAQTSGIETQEIQLLSTTTTEVDLYDNYVKLLGKQFISPLANGAFLNYEFAKIGEEYDGPDTVFVIDLRPKSRFDPVFDGRLWIDSRNYALRKADIHLVSDPNINFVEGVRIRQEYEERGEDWYLQMRDVEIDFRNGKDQLGLVGRTATFIRDYDPNPQFPENFFNGEVLEIQTRKGRQDSAFWADNRATPLERSDQMGYELMTELKRQPVWQFYKVLTELLASGSKRVGNLYLGPYGRLVGFNPVECWRTQVGVFSHPELHPRLDFNVWGAYGFRDERFKYMAEASYKLRLKPMIRLRLRRTENIEQTGMGYFGQSPTTAINSLLQRVPLENLNYYTENYAAIDGYLARGLMGRLLVQHKHFEPAFDFGYRPTEAAPPEDFATEYTTFELGTWFRISFNEDYMLKYHERIYMDSPWPKLYAEYRAGLKGVLNSDFNYHHLKLTLTDNLKLGRAGWVTYTLSAGNIWGTAPFPSLYVFRGSQSYAMTSIGFSLGAFQAVAGNTNTSALYDEVGFNLMYFYEFVADRYIVGGFDHHTEGWLWRKLPLLRRLKFKELWTFRAGWGTLREANRRLNSVSDPGSDFFQTVQAPDGQPYAEIGVGLENILKVIRIDYIWRLTYRNPEAPGRLADFNYNSGIRFYLSVSF